MLKTLVVPPEGLTDSVRSIGSVLCMTYSCTLKNPAMA